MRILCFGDSNTWGYDPRSWLGDRYAPNDRWPELLGKQTGWEVINDGCCGREIPRQCMQLPDADLLLVMLGTNDLLQGASAEEAAERMARFLPADRPVLLIAPPPMKRGAWVPTDALAEESLRLAAAYQELAQQRNIPFADTRSWDIGLVFDGVHFTEAGHHRFAEKIASEIRK